MIQITMVQNTFKKKTGYKNAYQLTEIVTKVIDNKQHNLITNIDTCKWFRQLGGSESVSRSYTCNGYCVTKLISISPDKEIKKVRVFTFKDI